MNSYRRLFIIIAVGAALWAALRFSSDPKSSTQEVPTPPTDLPLPTTGLEGPPSEEPMNVSQTTPNPQLSLPLFGPHLRKIGECLQINNTLDDKAELSFGALQESLRGNFGEISTINLEWKNTHLTLPNGERRRLRLETEAVGEEGSVMRLMYYSVDAEDLPVPIPLSEDQSLNPTEAYISSLESEGTVTLREEAYHGLFSNGAEIFYSQKNGVLSEIEISFEGRSVTCQDLQNPQSTCTCF